MNYSSLNELAVVNIRAMLGARRESIVDLAISTGIARSTMKRRLLQKSPFTLDELESISTHFQINPSDLIAPMCPRSESFNAEALAAGKEN